MQHHRPPSAGGSSSVLSLTQSIRWSDTDDVEIISTSEKMRMAAGLEAFEKREKITHGRRQEEHVLRILAENEMLRSTVSAYR